MRVLLGITGGIATYKVAELARLFVRGGHEVQVVMTEAATRFVTPLTFQTISGRSVALELFSGESGGKVHHISLADQADLMVVAPASANTLGKMACGIADNLLTTLYLSVTCPVILVPSMNDAMLNHASVRENMERLRERGCLIMEPGCGELACGVVGRGRLPEPLEIYNYVESTLAPKDYQGIRALVTAGPTREHLDPVRYISNPSTGLMGYSIARALACRGAVVTLVSGPSSLACPAGVERINVTSAQEMFDAVLSRYLECDLVVKAAAVSDYRPVVTHGQKVKKGAPTELLELIATPDILKELGQRKHRQLLVGFAAETDNPELHARHKLQEKKLDLVVVNDLTVPGAGFASPTNQAALIGSDGVVEHLPLMSKEELAGHILDRLVKLFPSGMKADS